MKQGKDAQQDVIPMKIIKPVHLAHVCDQIVVSKHDAFGQAGSPARIWQRYQIFFGINLYAGDVAVTVEQSSKGGCAFRFTKDEQFLDVGRAGSGNGSLDEWRRS